MTRLMNEPEGSADGLVINHRIQSCTRTTNQRPNTPQFSERFGSAKYVSKKAEVAWLQTFLTVYYIQKPLSQKNVEESKEAVELDQELKGSSTNVNLPRVTSAGLLLGMCITYSAKENS